MAPAAERARWHSQDGQRREQGNALLLAWLWSAVLLSFFLWIQVGKVAKVPAGKDLSACFFCVEEHARLGEARWGLS